MAGAFRMPNIDDSTLSTERGRKALVDFLHSMVEQLNFTLSHLDEANLAEGVLEQIQGASSAIAQMQQQTQSGFDHTVSRDRVIAAVNESAETAQIAWSRVASPAATPPIAAINASTETAKIALTRIEEAATPTQATVGFLETHADGTGDTAAQVASVSEPMKLYFADGAEFYVPDGEGWRLALRLGANKTELFGTVEHDGTEVFV